MAKLKIQQTNSVTSQAVDSYASSILIGGNHVGGVGGLTSQSIATILPRVKVGSASNADGSILAQKGASKFQVTDGTNTGVCTLVDKANGSLGANEMSITVTKQDASTFRAKRITNKWVYDFSGNKYRYWFASATTNNTYAVDAAAGVTGFVQVASA